MRSLRRAILLMAVFVSATPALSLATASHAQSPETATQFYLRWRAAALKAKSMDEITPFWTADTVKQFNMEPESARAGTVTMLKRIFDGQTDVRVVEETATPAGARLSLEGLDKAHKPIVSSVDLVKENGAWKVTAAVEQWKPKGND